MKIMSTTLTGINTARVRFEKSAENLLNTVAPVSEPEQVSSELQPVAAIPEIGVQSTAYTASDAALVESSVDMMTSSFAYKANIQILKAWNETTESVLSELTA
jgi:flagellar basal body rod protein FlgC